MSLSKHVKAKSALFFFYSEFFYIPERPRHAHDRAAASQQFDVGALYASFHSVRAV